MAAAAEIGDDSHELRVLWDWTTRSSHMAFCVRVSTDFCGRAIQRAGRGDAQDLDSEYEWRGTSMHGISRILAVDDDEGLASVLGRVLRREFQKRACVATMTDSVEARRWIEKFRPEVIITDLEMPKVDGFVLCRDASRWNPSVRVIAFSGHPDPSVARRALRSGASAFVAKDGDFAELLAVIDHALRSLPGGQSATNGPIQPTDPMQCEPGRCSAE
jgi:CheY-like chemotaxis protein